MQSEKVIADPTLVACDVCGEINPPGNGGALLLDKDNTYTIECQDCWENFTSLPPHQRIPKNAYVFQAILQEVGTEPISYELFDHNKPFVYNAYETRIKNLKQMTHYHDPFDKNPKVIFTPDVEKEALIVVYCGHCSKTSPKKGVLYCSKCKLCTYCGKDCQRKDWARHKITCNEFTKVREEINKQ